MDPTPLNQTAPLPPMPLPGVAMSDEDQDLVWNYLSRLALQERQESAAWVTQADQSEVIYFYGDYPPPPDDRLVINDIQNQVISTVDAQTKERPVSSIEPRETGEPADYYWAGDRQLGLAIGIPPQSLGLDPADNSPIPPQPLPYALGARLCAAAESGQPFPLPTPPTAPTAQPAIDPVTGQPAPPPSVAIDEDMIVTVDDATTADFFQGVHDALWELGSLDPAIESAVLWNDIHGYLAWLYEFDADPDPARPPLPRLRKMSIKQVYLDSAHEDVRDMQHVGMDVVLDMHEAEAMFPDLAPFIRTLAATGEPRRPDTNTNYGQAADKYFQKPMITMRIFWLRNQVMPLAEADAVAGGHVVQGQVPAEIEPQGASDEQQRQPTDGEVEPNGGQSEGDAGGGGTAGLAGGVGVEAGDGIGAELSGDSQGGQLPTGAVRTRPALLHPATGEELTPGHPAWPTRRGVRQIVTIGGDAQGRVPEDRECPHWDFPVVHLRNIPAPGRPFGQGEPVRLLKVQRANSGVGHAMVECAKQAAAPLQVLPASVAARYKKEYGSAYVEPGTVIVVEDAVLQQWAGKIDFVVPPPQMPLALVQLQPILGQWIDRLSGYGDADRGILPSAGTSGKTVELLQQGSGAMKSFKAKGLRYLVQRLTRLILHNAVHHMSVEQLAMLARKYKPEIVAAFQQRGRMTDFDVSVKVAADGAARQQKQAEARANRQANITSLETTHDALGIDHKTEKRRLKAEAEEQAQVQAQAQAEAMAARGPAAAPAKQQ